MELHHVLRKRHAPEIDDAQAAFGIARGQHAALHAPVRRPRNVEHPGFERVVFGSGEAADVELPAEATGHGFRVYRAADLVLVRNTGEHPLWVRGRSLESGAYLRMRERQQIVLPGWTLTAEDLVSFLNVKLTGKSAAIFLASTDEGLTSERARQL